MSSTLQKWKGSQTSGSRRDSNSPNKQQSTGSLTRFSTSGALGSHQRGDTPSPDVTKFRPNSEAESRFNRSFKSRPVFVSKGVMLNDFSKILILLI